jgi:hypothetical protein
LMNTFDTSFTIHPSGDSSTDLSTTLMPVIGPGDSTGWVTHQLNLTPFINHPTPIRIAFRYVSTDIDAGAWTIDNIQTSPISLFTPELPGLRPDLALIGTLSENQLSVTCRCPENGDYTISLWDMSGRKLMTRSSGLRQGENKIVLPCPDFASGIYLLEVGNEQYRKVVRVVRF